MFLVKCDECNQRLGWHEICGGKALCQDCHEDEARKEMEETENKPR